MREALNLQMYDLLREIRRHWIQDFVTQGDQHGLYTVPAPETMRAMGRRIDTLMSEIEATRTDEIRRSLQDSIESSPRFKAMLASGKSLEEAWAVLHGWLSKDSAGTVTEIENDALDDNEWMVRILPQYNTPLKALKLVLENEEYFGYDPYYKDIRQAVLTQVEKVFKESIEDGPKLDELRETIKECLKALRRYSLSSEDFQRLPNAASMRAAADSHAAFLTAIAAVEASLA